MKLLGLFLLPSSGLLWPLTVPQPKARRVLEGGFQVKSPENWSSEGMVAMGEGIECRIPPSLALPDSTPKLVFFFPHKPHSLVF